MPHTQAESPPPFRSAHSPPTPASLQLSVLPSPASCRSLYHLTYFIVLCPQFSHSVKGRSSDNHTSREALGASWMLPSAMPPPCHYPQFPQAHLWPSGTFLFFPTPPPSLPGEQPVLSSPPPPFPLPFIPRLLTKPDQVPDRKVHSSGKKHNSPVWQDALARRHTPLSEEGGREVQ